MKSQPLLDTLISVEFSAVGNEALEIHAVYMSTSIDPRILVRAQTDEFIDFPSGYSSPTVEDNAASMIHLLRSCQIHFGNCSTVYLPISIATSLVAPSWLIRGHLLNDHRLLVCCFCDFSSCSFSF